MFEYFSHSYPVQGRDLVANEIIVVCSKKKQTNHLENQHKRQLTNTIPPFLFFMECFLSFLFVVVFVASNRVEPTLHKSTGSKRRWMHRHHTCRHFHNYESACRVNGITMMNVLNSFEWHVL